MHDLARVLDRRVAPEEKPARLRELPQLLDRGGALKIGRDEHHALPLLLEERAELPRERGLAGALEAREEDARGRLWRKREPFRFAPEQIDQRAMHRADHVLPRREALEHLLADGVRAHGRDEVLHDLKMNVGLEERDAHLAQGILDVLLGQLPAAAQALEDGIESCAQIVEHGFVTLQEGRGGGPRKLEAPRPGLASRRRWIRMRTPAPYADLAV